ncbi:MAG: ribosome-binding factor RbfA [Bacteroidota bacterium]|jgi:ribosome-binding factor A
MGLRQEKFARQLQKDLGDVFLQHKDWVAGEFVTISGVAVSPDLSSAKIYLSLFNTPKKAKVLEAIELNAREIRMEIAKKVKNQVKKVPELRFYEDESQEYAAKIDKLLESIKKD